MSTVTQKVKEPVRLKLSQMTKQEARIAIAKDVVAQIRAERYTARTGAFTVMDDGDDGSMTKQGAADAVRAGQHKCSVCAVGAGVVSAAGLFNKLPDGDELCWGVIVDETGTENYAYLGKFFPRATLIQMEDAFERADFANDRGVRLSREAEDAAIAFGSRWADDADRLEAVWANVLANEGAFDPTWLPSKRTRLGREMRESQEQDNEDW